jgi:hypothetical protein
VGSVEVVEVLPLLELLVEHLGVVDHHTVEQSVELLFVDAVGSLDFPVEPRGADLDVAVSDAAVEEVPVEGALELGTVEFLSGVKRHDALAWVLDGPVDGALRDSLLRRFVRLAPRNEGPDRAGASTHQQHPPAGRQRRCRPGRKRRGISRPPVLGGVSSASARSSTSTGTPTTWPAIKQADRAKPSAHENLQRTQRFRVVGIESLG